MTTCALCGTLSYTSLVNTQDHINVKDDRSMAYECSKTSVMKWRHINRGLKT